MVVWNFGIDGYRYESPEATGEEVQEVAEMPDLVEDRIPSMCLSLLSVYVIVSVLKFVFILYTFLVCR